MRRFVIRQNIERYTELLKRHDLEAPRRRTLERLLAEERSKLADGREGAEAEPDRGSRDPRARE